MRSQHYCEQTKQRSLQTINVQLHFPMSHRHWEHEPTTILMSWRISLHLFRWSKGTEKLHKVAQKNHFKKWPWMYRLDKKFTKMGLLRHVNMKTLLAIRLLGLGAYFVRSLSLLTSFGLVTAWSRYKLPRKNVNKNIKFNMKIMPARVPKMRMIPLSACLWIR